MDKTKMHIAKLLIENGARVKVTSDKGRTPLLLAVLSRNTDLVRLLIERGARVEVKIASGTKEDPYDGHTALMIARENGDDEIARMLEAAGAK